MGDAPNWSMAQHLEARMEGWRACKFSKFENYRAQKLLKIFSYWSKCPICMLVKEPGFI